MAPGTGWPVTVVDRAPHWWRRWSLRTRLTVAATLVLAFALVIAAVALLLALGKAMLHTVDASSLQRAKDVAAMADSGRLPAVVPVSGGTTTIQVLDRHGRIIATSPAGDHLVPILNAARRHAAIRDEQATSLDGRPYGLPRALRVVAVRAHNGDVVIAATSFSQVNDSMDIAVRVVVLGMPLLLALLAVVCALVVGRTLRPIEALRRGAAAVTGTAYAGRLPVPQARDEVRRLALTLNDMLDRLAAANDRQRALVSDAAHELRSPLAAIRTQLEVAIDHPPEDWRETANDVLTDTLRLSRLAEDLLTLARLDEQGTPGSRPN